MRIAIIFVLLMAGCSRSAEPGFEPDAAPLPYGIKPATTASEPKWRPALASGHPNDLPDQVCRWANSLGCKVTSTCAQELRAKGSGGRLWSKRLATVLSAKNKQEVNDSTVLPCAP
jgi:hypothetical protein